MHYIYDFTRFKYLICSNEPPTHVKEVLNDSNVTLQRRGIGSIGDISTAGLDDLIKKSKWPGETQINLIVKNANNYC